MDERPLEDPGRHVRDAEIPMTPTPIWLSAIDLGHGGHPDGVGAPAPERADLRRRLVGRPVNADVDALLQDDAFLFRDRERDGAEVLAVRIDMSGKRGPRSSSFAPTRGFVPKR